MNYLPFAVLAYILNGVAVLIDKFMLSRYFPDPLVYIFYFSIFSLVSLFIIPFTKIPTPQTFILSSTYMLFWLLGSYLMFKGLQKGLASRVIPVIGALVPIFLISYYGFLNQSIDEKEKTAVVILLAGFLFLILPNLKGKLKIEELILEIFSAIFFAISYIFLRNAYQTADFLQVFAWSKLVVIPIGLTLFAYPKTRRIILTQKSGVKWSFFTPQGILFISGQFSGGLSELLITFSISLANPALVNSLQGVQYVFLFMASILLAKKLPSVYKEKFSFLGIILKLLGVLIIAAGLYTLAFTKNMAPKTFGVTFSSNQAKYLGLDWKKTYLEMLTDLKVTNLRLGSFWSNIEPNPGQFDFKDLDFMLDQASYHDAKVLLVIGIKQPGWPECHLPNWARQLSISNRQGKALEYIQKVVDRYKNDEEIWGWQVENEPLLTFGQNCDVPDAKFLQTEVQMVRSWDSSRPVVITDSGEWSPWITSMKLSNILGISVYRKAYNPQFGYIKYPIPSLVYDLKSTLIRLIFAPQNQKTIISELQTEPWTKNGIENETVDSQVNLFTLADFQDSINFVKSSQFTEAYFWGVEWWAYAKINNHPEYWDFAKIQISRGVNMIPPRR